MNKRVFLIVLDSFGIGASEDAVNFGDVEANTLRRISKSEKFNIPNLVDLGIGLIDGVSYIQAPSKPLARVARLRELSKGKDTTIGHWEIAGVLSPAPMPTYENGFPDSVISKFECAVGKKAICNKPYSGTEVIKDYGEEHLKTGALIVYTSADSVFQIAAHEDSVPPEELYEICKKARAILTGEHAVGRVIARPFVGKAGSFRRTENRRDFSLAPPEKTLLDAISECGLDVISVGKISDIFTGRGITESYHTHSNKEGMEITASLLEKNFSGLCFVNLVDFDMVFGHRQDINGYAEAISEFDEWLGGFIQKLSPTDTLIITADHGCDPGDNSTDHTREFVPLLIYEKGKEGKNLGTKNGFGTISNYISRSLKLDFISEKFDEID